MNDMTSSVCDILCGFSFPEYSLLGPGGHWSIIRYTRRAGTRKTGTAIRSVGHEDGRTTRQPRRIRSAETAPSRMEDGWKKKWEDRLLINDDAERRVLDNRFGSRLKSVSAFAAAALKRWTSTRYPSSCGWALQI